MCEVCWFFPAWLWNAVSSTAAAAGLWAAASTWRIHPAAWLPTAPRHGWISPTAAGLWATTSSWRIPAATWLSAAPCWRCLSSTAAGLWTAASTWRIPSARCSRNRCSWLSWSSSRCQRWHASSSCWCPVFAKGYGLNFSLVSQHYCFCRYYCLLCSPQNLFIIFPLIVNVHFVSAAC